MHGPQIENSALIIVDMQNDFLHPAGGFAARARANPGRVDMDFLQATIGPTKALADAFRAAKRPVIYITHDLTTAYQICQNIVVLYRGAVAEEVVEVS